VQQVASLVVPAVSQQVLNGSLAVKRNVKSAVNNTANFSASFLTDFNQGSKISCSNHSLHVFEHPWALIKGDETRMQEGVTMRNPSYSS